ncbi:MAG: hypothetical protein RL417_1884 [Pseudomonadota bacterium]|jgi:ABC-type transport system involved in cytochrome c biogenesis permease component
MSGLWALVRKDLTLELRTKETLGVNLFLSLVIAVVAALGVNSAFVGGDVVVRLFPALLWISFLFSATTGAARTYEPELEHMAVEGFLLTGCSPANLFVSKWFSSVLIMSIGQFLNLAALSVLLDVSLVGKLAALLLVSLLVIAGFSSLTTLLGGVSSTSRLKGVLLPVILFPLSFPLFFAAIELSMGIVVGTGLPMSSPWLSLLVGLDVLYFVLGFNLIEHVVRE